MTSPPPTPAARAERTSARVALWTSLALTATIGILLGHYSRPIPAVGYSQIAPDQALWQGIDFLAFPEVQLLQQYVQIDTSHPEPDEVAGAEFLAAQLAAAGIPSTIERLGDRRANLWAFVEGDDPRALVLHGHLDVEPAQQQEGWVYPPFGGVVDGPWIYGRGMYDMKSLTIAQLLATIDAATSGERPKRSLLFLQTSSEETGSVTGTRWVLDEHPELVARMATVLTEGGVVEATGPSEVKYWGIEFAQKQYGRIVYCASDRASLEPLRALLLATAGGDPLPDVDPLIRRFLAHYAPTRDLGLYPLLLAEPALVPLDRPRFDRLSDFLKSLFRNELKVAPVLADDEGGYRLEVWLHLLPNQDLATVAAEMIPTWSTFGVAASPLERISDGKVSSLDHPDYLALERAVRERFPDTAVGPFFLLQAMTDAHRFRSAGISAYGFSPFPVVVMDTIQIAKPNERMQLPAFRTGVDLYRAAVRRLLH